MMSTRNALLLVTALSAMVGCGSTDTSEQAGASIGGKADDRGHACGALCGGVAPDAPLADDPRFSIEGAQQWLLIGDGLTADEALALEVLVPSGTAEVVAWFGDEPFLLQGEADRRTLAIDVSALAPGTYEVLLAEAGADEAFARHTFTRSYPLYVSVSIDWDGPDPPDANLERQERLHARHAHLALTHLVGPYTFTAGLDPARVTAITGWLNGMRDTHGDEIGLHIHPYCHFVEQAGVTCRRDPTFYAVEEARAGYTVFLTSYTEDEMRSLLATAKELFVENGLGTPTSFRAGAWAAQSHTLRALSAEGFVVEGSAVNWPLLEEWEGNGPLFGFLRDNWSPINALSQPYHPAEHDHLASGVSNLALLELPDNGALVDYVRADEMTAVVEANLGDGVLRGPRAVSIGYHVDNFSEAYFARMTGALDHIDARLDAADAGPIVYARMSDLAKVDWTASSGQIEILHPESP